VEFPIHPDFLPEVVRKEKSSEKNTKKDWKEAPGKDPEEKKGSEKNSGKGSEKSLDNRPNEILTLIRKTPTITIRELSEELNISTRAVEKHINSLKKAGKLKRMGSRKEGWWKVVE
jgi:predicted HTH transcriptional regulator